VNCAYLRRDVATSSPRAVVDLNVLTAWSSIRRAVGERGGAAPNHFFFFFSPKKKNNDLFWGKLLPGALQRDRAGPAWPTDSA